MGSFWAGNLGLSGLCEFGALFGHDLVQTWDFSGPRVPAAGGEWFGGMFLEWRGCWGWWSDEMWWWDVSIRKKFKKLFWSLMVFGGFCNWNWLSIFFCGYLRDWMRKGDPIKSPLPNCICKLGFFKFRSSHDYTLWPALNNLCATFVAVVLKWHVCGKQTWLENPRW